MKATLWQAAFFLVLGPAILAFVLATISGGYYLARVIGLGDASSLGGILGFFAAAGSVIAAWVQVASWWDERKEAKRRGNK